MFCFHLDHSESENTTKAVEFLKLRELATSLPNMDDKTILAAKLPVKRTATHIYFFGYEGPDPEGCFQQWYPSHFEDKDLDGSPSFRTSEHYMMYRKAVLFGDEAVASRIMAAVTPGEAKAFGRLVG